MWTMKRKSGIKLRKFIFYNYSKPTNKYIKDWQKKCSFHHVISMRLFKNGQVTEVFWKHKPQYKTTARQYCFYCFDALMTKVLRVSIHKSWCVPRTYQDLGTRSHFLILSIQSHQQEIQYY